MRRPRQRERQLTGGGGMLVALLAMFCRPRLIVVFYMEAPELQSNCVRIGEVTGPWAGGVVSDVLNDILLIFCKAPQAKLSNFWEPNDRF